jgi:hypothetical protein
MTLWMDVGNSSDNARRLVNISKLADKLGPIVCKALPGFHALTGCDYTAAFFRKGKIYLRSYVCNLYNLPLLSDVNAARYKLFMSKYQPSDPGKPLQKIKGLDASILPPCADVLHQKLLRTNYVSFIWKHAHLQDADGNEDPINHGWQRNGNALLYTNMVHWSPVAD